MNDGFLITIRSQPKHGLLYAALKKHGNLDKLSTVMGISRSSLCHWINLRSYPRSIFRGYAKRRKRIENGLGKVLGVGIDECWPKEIRDFIDRTYNLKSLIFEQTKEVPLRQLTSPVMNALTYNGDQERSCNVTEARDAIKEALKMLSYREREVVKLRYGLGDGYVYTLDEAAHIFKVTRDRIRQIEAKAIRKLRELPISNHLVNFLD